MTGSSTTDFERMRKAETRRRRKRVANLALARKGSIKVTTQRTHVLWTPPK